jgi:hypothetical protein
MESHPSSNRVSEPGVLKRMDSVEETEEEYNNSKKES